MGLLEPALEEALTLQNRPQIATLKRQLGYAALCQDDLARAARLAAEAVSVAASGGYRMIQASALHLQAMVHLRQGSDGGAGRLAAEQAIAIAQALGARPALARMSVTRESIERVRTRREGI